MTRQSGLIAPCDVIAHLAEQQIEINQSIKDTFAVGGVAQW